MATSFGVSEMEAAIANCALEPIHTPGATQSFGAAVVVDTSSRITHVSQSVERFFGVRPRALLGAEIRDVLAGELGPAWVRVCSLRPDQVVNLPVVLAGKGFDVAGWRRADGVAILSLVPAGEEGPPSLVEELADLQRDLGETPSLQMLCDRAAALLSELSGYDRVMVYQFDAEGNGAVVSEARREAMEPFLGLHYPASDIPAQARALYLRHRSRVLADTMAEADPLIALDPSSPPVDLSLSLVRAHSPVHVQYLRNMGVRATLVVSIVTTGGHLWGLVACHHLSPRVPSTRVRLLSDLVAPILAVRIQLQEESERRRADAQAATARHDMLRLFASSGAAGRTSSRPLSPRLASRTSFGAMARHF